MENPLLTKLLNNVNFDLVDKFDKQRMEELSFISVNIQGEALYVAIPTTADTSAITNYVKKVVDNKINFIHLSEERYVILTKLFKSKLATMDYEQTASQYSKHYEEGVVDADDFVNMPDILEMQNNALDIFTLDDEDEENSETSTQILEEEDLLGEEPVEIILEDTDDIQIDETIQEGGTYGPVVIEENTTVYHSSGEVVKKEVKKEKADSKEAEDQDEVYEEGEIEDGAVKEHHERIKKVKAPQTKKLGEILIEENMITEKQLTIALAESKALDIPLGSVLVKLGYVTIQDLKDALGAQQGLELATTEQLKAIPSVINVLSEDFVRINKVIPLSMTKKSLVVGMVNPGDTKIINEIVYQTGLKPTVMMITHFEYENFLKTYYKQSSNMEADRIIEQIKSEDVQDEEQESLWEQVEKEIQTSKGSVSKFAYNIIIFAIEQGASDIHIEPRFDGYVVRYRTDGILKEVFKIPTKVDTQLITRFKVLSRMNIAEHRRTQDGNFTIAYKNQHYDFRINTLPVAGKEKMVIRVLAPAVTVSERKTKITIEGASNDDVEKIKYLISSPNGIILTSGPTGSGKTTTLYSLISYLNNEKVNITTIEDPVEIKLDGVNQSAVNPKAGITFASCMRAILRQDPDIILVGEIRDFETLEVAISASLTGHLVLSTIHTNSAAATITRLIEMGAKDYLISSTVSGVLAQRLVRKLCPSCRVPYQPTVEEAKKILTDPIEIANFTKSTIYKPGGCSLCNDTGYAGRTGIYEILVINKEIRKLIAQRAHDVVIEEYAVENGMRTLRMACLDHIKNGVTAVEEFIRTLGMVSD